MSRVITARPCRVIECGQLGHDFADFAQKQYFRGRALSIYGGSDEVQKNVTAKHVLGL